MHAVCTIFFVPPTFQIKVTPLLDSSGRQSECLPWINLLQDRKDYGRLN